MTKGKLLWYWLEVLLESCYLFNWFSYQGKTKQCLPKVKFPDDYLISFTPNHWCNDITMEAYVYKFMK